MEHLIQVNINFNGKQELLNNKEEDFIESNEECVEEQNLLYNRINEMESYIDSLKSQIKEFEIDQTFVEDYQHAEITGNIGQSGNRMHIPSQYDYSKVK